MKSVKIHERGEVNEVKRKYLKFGRGSDQHARPTEVTPVGMLSSWNWFCQTRREDRKEWCSQELGPQKVRRWREEVR